MHGTLKELPTMSMTKEDLPQPTSGDRCWWQPKTGLDIRPVLWSLRNRPNEWTYDRGRYCIEHKPSRHEFWISNGFWFYRLYEAHGCSCKSDARGSFSFLQKIAFDRAYNHWKRNHADAIRAKEAAKINEQFRQHFLTP